MDWSIWLDQAFRHVRAWEAGWGPFSPHPSLVVEAERWEAAVSSYLERLEGNYPFFHPRYAGQMLKPPHPAALVGYLAAQCINPNNHALDGGPPTSEMEKEVVKALAGMFHYPDVALGHLTSSGTIANLEALWVAREIHPERGIAVSRDAHYTHARMSQVLRMPCISIPTDSRGRIQLEALETELRTGSTGTVVLTAGTTGLGSVDPIDEAVSLCQRYGVRVHVDAAYGGFFSILSWAAEGSSPLLPGVAADLRAIAACDSVVVDPHKHGLQPYGCGCVLFRDPAIGRFYRHDSPYSYFTSEALHLGEISLECSRAGASAGAFWLTLQVLPLHADEGLGPILSADLRAAQRWSEKTRASDVLREVSSPMLDIVTYFPHVEPLSTSRIDEASQQLFERAMQDPKAPVYLSVLRADGDLLQAHYAALERDQTHARVLRSVLMKPEHETYVDELHAAIEGWAASLPAA